MNLMRNTPNRDYAGKAKDVDELQTKVVDIVNDAIEAGEIDVSDKKYKHTYFLTNSSKSMGISFSIIRNDNTPFTDANFKTKILESIANNEVLLASGTFVGVNLVTHILNKSGSLYVVGFNNLTSSATYYEMTIDATTLLVTNYKIEEL